MSDFIPPPQSLWIRFAPSSRVASNQIDHYVEKLRRSAKIGLNLGCGEHPIPGLINCDLYSEKADQRVDILDLSSFRSNSVDLIEAHHLFEHLSFSERGKALEEWRRVLRQGGYLVLSVPDLVAVCRRWLLSYCFRNFKVDEEGVPYEERMLFGPQSNPGMFHKSGYGRRTLTGLLEGYGLDCEFSASPYPDRATPSLFIVARKR